MKFSRLDFFILSADIQSSIASSDILSGYRTDHNIVTITLKKLNLSQRGLCWKFNNSLLNDEKYGSMIKKEIKNVNNTCYRCIQLSL